MEFLEENFKRRRESLRDELISAGMSGSSLEGEIALRCSAYESFHRAQLNSSLLAEEQQARNSLKEEFSSRIDAAKAITDKVKANISIGFDALRVAERKRLAEQLKKRREVREKELQSQNVSSDEIAKVLQEEFSALDTADVQALEAEFVEYETAFKNFAVEDCNDRVGDMRSLSSLEGQSESGNSGAVVLKSVYSATMEAFKAGLSSIESPDVAVVENNLLRIIENIRLRKELTSHEEQDRAFNGHDSAVQVRIDDERKFFQKTYLDRCEMLDSHLISLGVSKENAIRLRNSALGSMETAFSLVEKSLIAKAEQFMTHSQTSLANATSVWDANKAKFGQKEDLEAAEFRRNRLLSLFEKFSAIVDGSIAQSNDSWTASKNLREKVDKEVQELRNEFDQEAKEIVETIQSRLRREQDQVRSEGMDRVVELVQKFIEQGMDEASAKLKAESEVVPDIDSRLDEVWEKLTTQEKEMLLTKRKELERREIEVIENQFGDASNLKKAAVTESQSADKKVEELRQQHDVQLKALETRLAVDHKNQEANLRARLLERAQKNALGEGGAPTRTESEELAELHQRQEAEKQRTLANIKKEQEKQLLAALKLAANKSREVKAAIAREVLLEAERGMKKRAQEELDLREVQRVRDQSARDDEKRRAALDAKRDKMKGKLHERLQQKKQNKELELKQEEERLLSELAQKHKDEIAQKERLQKEKTLWMDLIKTSFENAEKLGLSGHSKEDFCFSETLGKKAVPEDHLSEAAQIILGPRHSDEMASLLQNNFNERISALRSAVESVLETKNKERIALMDQIATSSMSDADKEAAMKRFEDEYNVKQRNAEESVIGRLEVPHTKQQMELRQRQLEEIASAVTMYSDADQLKRIREITGGKSQEESLAEYRQKLESESAARQERLEKEREAAEEKMRLEHQARLKEVQESLMREEAEAEKLMEAKRQELVKQSEEFMKKQAAALGEQDNAEKERIRAEFEKEQQSALEAMEHDRKTKKEKLQERLNAKRSQNAAKRKEAAAAVLPIVPEAIATPGVSSTAEAIAAAQAAASAAAAIPIVERIPASKADVVDSAGSAVVVKSMKLIEAKLEKIDKVMSLIEANGGLPASKDTEAKLEKFDRIIDILEKNGMLKQKEEEPPKAPEVPPVAVTQDSTEPAPGAVLVVIPDEQLSMQDTARLEFGKSILGMVGLQHIDLKAASQLPPSNLANNSFKNSYLYDNDDKVLFIHSNRLASSGDFSLALIHALSHIKVLFLVRLYSCILFSAESYLLCLGQSY
jgi:hypothetical protein